MKDRQDEIHFLLTKLKWAEIDADIAAKNGQGGVVNYMKGQAWAYKSVLWEVYGMGNADADAIVANEINGRA